MTKILKSQLKRFTWFSLNVIVFVQQETNFNKQQETDANRDERKRKTLEMVTKQIYNST